MAHFLDVARDSQGNAIGSPTITVHFAGTASLASLFTNPELTTPLANPFTGDADGSYEFYAAVGQYKITVAKTGYTTFAADYVDIGTTGLGVASGILANRPAAGTFGRFYYVTDAATPHLSFDTGAAWLECPINGTYTPTANGGPIRLLTVGSSILPATNTGIRKALLTLFSSDPDDDDSAAIHIEQVQTSHPTPGTLARTGLSVNSYTEPDDGGDVSGILVLSTGGCNAISAYKTHLKRPAGYTNYQGAAGGACEFGTADQYFAVNVVAGAQIGGTHSNRSTGLRVRIDNAVSDGIIVEPGGLGAFDTRYAFLTGQLQTNAAPVNVKCFIYLNGDAQFARLAVGPVGGAVNPGVSVGGQPTTFATEGYASLDGIRIKGTDAANTVWQSVLNAALAITTNGGPLILGAGVGATHLQIDANGYSTFAGRILGKQGSNIVAANDITLGNGNFFAVTGNTQINTIASTAWTPGSMVTLQFTGTPTVKHATAGTGAQIHLAGAADFVASADDTLVLVYNGSVWVQVGRTVI